MLTDDFVQRSNGVNKLLDAACNFANDIASYPSGEVRKLLVRIAHALDDAHKFGKYDYVDKLIEELKKKQSLCACVVVVVAVVGAFVVVKNFVSFGLRFLFCSFARHHAVVRSRERASTSKRCSIRCLGRRVSRISIAFVASCCRSKMLR